MSDETKPPETRSARRLAALQAEEARRKESRASRGRPSLQRTPEELAELGKEADALRASPKRMESYMREAATFAVVMLREEMESNPDTKTRMDASKQLLSWGGIAARLMKKRRKGDGA